MTLTTAMNEHVDDMSLDGNDKHKVGYYDDNNVDNTDIVIIP